MKLGDDGLISKLIGAMAIGTGAIVAYAKVVRPWHLRWGATDAEFEESLPGDEVVPHPKHMATHAITIDAPVAEVWPWLVQIGQNRGGFYSYSWLENLVGCNLHNADRIVSEWQAVKVGDPVWLHPKAPPLPVVIVEPYRALVLGGLVEGPEPDDEVNLGAGTWGFYLKELDEKTTRLITRIRSDRIPGLRNWVANYVVLEPAHFIMERKMLLGIKRRAEESARRRKEESQAARAARIAAGAG